MRSTPGTGPALLLGAVIAGLLYAAFVPALRAVTDADLFWHLATGRWIAEYRAFPVVDPFSRLGVETGARWIAYSWLFELPVYALQAAFGWIGVSIYTLLLSGGIVLAILATLRRREDRLAPLALATLAAVLALWPLFTPRPWLLTLLFFLIELRILIAARESGRSRGLWLLLPLFVIWSNIHIQFVYGLFLIGLFGLESLLLPDARRIRPLGYGALLVASALATLVNPYGWDLARVVREYALEAPPPLQDLSPPDFRAVSEWIVLLLGVLAMAGAFLRRPRQPFLAFLVAVGLALFLRSRRDAWFAVAVGVSVLAETRPWPRPERGFLGARAARLSAPVVAGATGAALVFLLVAGYGPQFRNRWHEARQEEMLPVAAVGFLREHVLRDHAAAGAGIRGTGTPSEATPGPRASGSAGPLFNSFDWGGYLIWALPELPVAIDGRTNLHRPARLHRAWTTLDGLPGWDENPEFREARIVLVETNGPLARLLRTDPRYATTYADSVASVFVPATP